MDHQMIKQLEELQKAFAKISAAMLTKDDAKNFATKNDLQSFATKDDLERLATKDDLRNELAKYATTDDLKELKVEIIEKIREEIKESEGFIVGSVDKNKADKTSVLRLEKRVTRLEQKIVS